MGDTDLIARLYPFDDHLGYAAYAIEHSPRYVPPRISRQIDLEAKWNRRARGSTEPPETYDDVERLPCLELRFSFPPKNSRGFTSGTSEPCDFLIPIDGISRYHFVLTYKKLADGYYRLIVRDPGSTHGTKVTYDRKGDEVRSNFDWILGGDQFPNKTKEIVIHPHENLKFRIFLALQDITSPTYVANVERFLQGSGDAESLLGGLGLQSGPATELNSGAQTPAEERILIDRGIISKGGFGIVTRHWNVSTGQEYACKRPISKKDYDRKIWEKEIDLMRRIKHVRNEA